MGDNIENIIVGEVQQIIKKSVGRPIRPIKSENETTPKKKEYYVKKIQNQQEDLLQKHQKN